MNPALFGDNPAAAGAAMSRPPNGFKETELGPLPVEWEVVTLGEAVKQDKASINPQSYSSEVFDYYSIPAYQVSSKPMLEYGKEIHSQKLVVRPGTILFGKLNPRVPKVWRVTSKSEKRKIASTEFIPLVPVTEKIASEFLYYLAWSDYVLPKSQELVSGSTPSRQRVDVRAFLRIAVPLPPLSEQRGIARVLNAVQREIAAQEQLIAAAREVKRALMARLFTYGPGPEPARTKETEIGEVPEHWEVVRLGEVSSISTGTTPSTQETKYYDHGEYAFIKTAEISNGIIATAQTYITEEAIRNYNLKLYPPGTVFMAMYGQGKTRGQVSLLKIEAATTQNTAAIAPEGPIQSEYLWFYLMSQYERLRGEGIQGHISHLNLGYVKQLQIPLPPLPEQHQIARTLSAADRKITAEEQRKAALQEVFKSLLGELMTGRVRVSE